MQIGILGAGALGSAIARALARAGLEAQIANSRGADSLRERVAALGPGIRAAEAREAAGAEIVFLAVNWSRIAPLAAALGPWDGRIVIDATNPIEAPRIFNVDLGGRASSSVVAELFAGAQVVKAFNHLPTALLEADPRVGEGRRVLFYAGDDAASRERVGHLITHLGFAGIDLGTLDAGGRLMAFPDGPLATLDLVRHS